ncbi:hypothetical protein EDB19DRAFT_1824964 [Suillus lakei]|nr:hypothetical protein EDB19DRAFT_1824964 [Suillus lakei]
MLIVLASFLLLEIGCAVEILALFPLFGVVIWLAYRSCLWRTRPSDRSCVGNIGLVDVENRPSLTLAVALLTVGTRFSISPGQTGVTLSYIIMVQPMICQVTEVENGMNSAVLKGLSLPWREDWCRCADWYRELVESNSDLPSTSTSPLLKGSQRLDLVSTVLSMTKTVICRLGNVLFLESFNIHPYNDNVDYDMFVGNVIVNNLPPM